MLTYHFQQRPRMSTPVKIDFVSDVSCPWCAIGLKSLEQALDNIGSEADVSLHFQPFELNPQMAPEGQNIDEHPVSYTHLTLPTICSV